MSAKLIFIVACLTLAAMMTLPYMYYALNINESMYSKVQVPRYLLFKQNETKIEFKVSEVIIFDSKVLAKVLKIFRDRELEYFVEIPTRKIYYSIDEGVIGFSGIYTILWFNEKPEKGSEVPLLDFYGTVVHVNESSFIVVDYYGDKLYYRKVNGVYVLEKYGTLTLHRVSIGLSFPSNTLYLGIHVLLASYATLTLSFYLLYKIFKAKRELLRT